MAEPVIVISDGEEPEPRPRKRSRKSMEPEAPADLIDLTEDDAYVSGMEHSDVAVIDLTSCEGKDGFLDSYNTRLNPEQESSDSGDDCLYIKEESSDNESSLPDVQAHINRPLDLDWPKAATSPRSNSSEVFNKHTGKRSESSTPLNSDLGSLESLLPETRTSSCSSRGRSRHTSEDSLFYDIQDNNAKSCRTSPALQDEDLLQGTDSIENRLLCSRESSKSRPCPETQPQVTIRERCNSSSSRKGQSLIVSRETCDSRPSIEKPPHVSNKQSSNIRPFLEHPPLFCSIESSSNILSLEHPPHVSSRESCHSRPSLVSSWESCDRRSLVSSKESSDSTSSIKTQPISTIRSCDSRPPLEKPLCVCIRESVNHRHCLGTPDLSREPSNSPHIDSAFACYPQLERSSFQVLGEKPQEPLGGPLSQPCPCTGGRNGPDEANGVSLAPGMASKAWLNKLKYFRKIPIHHLFFHGLKPDAETIKNRRRQPVPISAGRLSMVNATIEEDFSQGTLQFLMEFVSPQHYPPKDIVAHVVRKILLCSEELDLLTEAYTLLMRIQQFHPANIFTVVWDWKLLIDVMEEKDKEVPGHLLFLRYVLQTLEDDFQANLLKRTLQKSIAKTMLSCDQHFSNIRDVIRWLIDAVSSCSPEDDTCRSPPLWPDVGSNRKQMVVCILQRMLTMAVEADKSPTLSSSRMADTMFPYVLSIPRRCQREIFFSTMESHLLRGKVLEVMFNHSCETPPTPSLSRTKILHFLKHSMLLLDDQGGSGEWQRWDEMLHHLYLLFISYESIVYDHLRTPLTERMDLTIQKARAPLMDDDIISKQDIDLHMGAFCRRISQGHEKLLDAQLQERTQVLRTVLYTATYWPPS